MSTKNLRDRRRARIRSKISGVVSRPRLSVFRSNTHIYVQLIDDVAGVTLASASDQKLPREGSKIDMAKKVGAEIGKIASEKGITSIVFDRGGFAYHGRVQALAESAREAGLQF